MIVRCFFLLVYFLLFHLHSIASPLDSVKVVKNKKALFIIHKVDKGDGLIALAKRYNTSVDEIKKANPKVKQLKAGQKINIPLVMAEVGKSDTGKISVDDSHANADSRDLNQGKVHIVQAGETLTKIALRYKISPQQIVKWNAIKNNKIETGQSLIVSGTSSIKSFEKWNSNNSITAKIDSVKNITSSSGSLVEESGSVTVMQHLSHPFLPSGSFVLCINPDTGKQKLIQIEQTTALSTGNIIGVTEDLYASLGLADTQNRIIIRYNQP